jgi:hypothetical protein
MAQGHISLSGRAVSTITAKTAQKFF